MMTRDLLQFIKRLVFCVLIVIFSGTALLSQKILSGNLNQPKTHVVTVSLDRITVDNVAGFSVGDTVLLIQMQGVEILTASSYGFVAGKVGEPGLHEFMMIQSINSGTKEVVFSNDIINTYDPLGNVQMVRVPYYNSAKVTGKLYCDPWDPVTKTGGVLALMVARNLTLNADIDVSGLGFKGGADAVGDGICRSSNQVLYGLDYYPASNTNAGLKGEGVANRTEFHQPLGTNYAKGLGQNWTGGGGGNGRYSGGGGGSNRGAGGDGGYESALMCPAPFPGGNGGIVADHPQLPNRIYLGGGGGASTVSATGSSGYGGNGGGIVIIVADGIIGGGNIIANGSNGGTTIGVGGCGGGGAGGSIALSLNKYGTIPLKLSVNGGNGGDNLLGYGEGGGGGGGLLYLRTPVTGNVTTELNGGTSGANGGASGETRPNFVAVLNGFLFNSISSSVTGNQVDSICSNMRPQKIIGTIPVGGSGSYTYVWQKSYNATFTSPITLTNDADPNNYTPPVTPETATVWYKRIISDPSLPTPDAGKVLKIIVQPFIKNNIVGNSDTICWSQDPPAFTSKATLQDGNGKYTFNWNVSLDNLAFTVPANSHNASGYTPPIALKFTSWYRRTVTSGRCVDSAAIAKITVLDTLQNNKILNLPPDICYGSTFNNLTGTTALTTPALKKGDNLYRFKWESNINGGGWTTAPGVSNQSGYDPVELAQRSPSNQYIFRRVVYSGNNNVCSSVSNAVLLKDFPVITNNSIAPVAPVCSGTPANIVGSKTPVLTGGNTNYVYSWEDSTKYHSWSLITAASLPDFTSPALTDTTRYRRTVKAVCSNVSKSIRVIVHKPILNNTISVLSGGVDQTICNNETPVSLKGSIATGGTNIVGDYAYLWKSSIDNSVFNPVSIGSTGINYAPASLSATTYYKRDVTSGACTVSSNSVTVTVLPLIANNTISGNPKVCNTHVPDIITGASLSGGSGSYTYLWQQSTDGTNWLSASIPNTTENYQPPALTSPIKYRRIVSSGLNNCCVSTSNEFDIAIDPLPKSPISAGKDDNIYSIEKIYHMQAIDPALIGDGETGTWEPLNDGTGVFDDPAKFNTTVRNLSKGNNLFLWTVHLGQCTLSDSVNIYLNEDFIPQGFSPNNGDDINNTFIIEGLDLTDQTVEMTVVNGAGTEVFSTSNRNGQKWANWDGKNSKGLDLPEGTYYYMMKITSTSGKIFKRKGFIILKRY